MHVKKSVGVEKVYTILERSWLVPLNKAFNPWILHRLTDLSGQYLSSHLLEILKTPNWVCKRYLHNTVRRS